MDVDTNKHGLGRIGKLKQADDITGICRIREGTVGRAIVSCCWTFGPACPEGRSRWRRRQ